jgi:predicted GNAT family acetyltransferase
VVLLHTEVPQRFSGQGVGSRLAQGVFEILKLEANA